MLSPNVTFRGMKMKSKLLVVLSTLALAIGMMAQVASQTAPATPSQDAKSCACCNHDKADAKAADDCCKDCCKDGKCAMMSKDGMNGAKCPMAKNGKMADGKMCCSGNKCPMTAKSGKGKGSCCCGDMDSHTQPGV
jgi:hypothetical protein